MTYTPRLRSAFPSTPTRAPRTPQWVQRGEQNGTPVTPRPQGFAVDESSARRAVQEANAPLIPFDLVDAPSQRLYVVAFYVLLNAWRLYEYWYSVDDLDSTWLFLKWVSVDAIFLFGLPAMRIPWLEWAFSTSLAIFLVHAVANAFLMFHIPIPVESWVAALVKVAYDRELSISERRVKPADILHNASLILGKQIIHILPEGSAILNPEGGAFCLGEQHPSTVLPIRINQTSPILIELLRFDLESGQNETITIPSKQAKQLKRQADKGHAKSDTLTPRDLEYVVRKTGIYQLRRVVDESKLDVHRQSRETVVVSCPRATIRKSTIDKCKGALSNLTLEVEGTPPLKIKYSRTLNEADHGVSFQSVQPENVVSPPLTELHSRPDFTWARSQIIEVPLNESLNAGGEWVYSINQVHDSCGNVVNYTSQDSAQIQEFKVHERPRISLTGCNTQNYLQAAKDDSIELPIHFHSVSQSQAADTPFTLTYSFTERSTSKEKQAPPEMHEVSLRSISHKPRIKEPGWYSITGISSNFCTGEVFEPASCYLHNPPEPQLSIRPEKVYDKCANNSVGLLVHLDLIGTPPFKIRYSTEHSKGIQTRVKSIDSQRGHLDLTPTEAGFYRYKFLDISDHVYESQSLKDKVPTLEQDVKPPASAHFMGPVTSRQACFGEPVTVEISFVGESPWELQYELVHNGKRTKYELRSESEMVTLTTDKLVDGGEYVLGLRSVKDKSNCRQTLKEEIKIEARAKRPQVAFGKVQGKREILALEDKKVELPLRLEGEAPWKIKYQNTLKPEMPPAEKTLWNQNSVIQVDQSGRYEIIEVNDATCPGSVNEKANVFNVSWIQRPAIVAVDGSPLDENNVLEKGEVCEGDENTMDLKLEGTPPYTIKYEQHRKPQGGSASVSLKTLTAALNSGLVRMDTSKAGDYSYKFIDIGDNLYNFDRKKQSPLTVMQRVHPRPAARFESPNRIYGFCKEEGVDEETMPILLEEAPPFTLEIGIKHHSNSKTDMLSIPNINSRRYNLPVPRRYLDLGQHVVSIRKVLDSRGCLRATEYDGSAVRVTISDVPTIIPLESKEDYCVGERLSFSLSGHAPFDVYYKFNGVERKATSQTTSFRRIAEQPGQFTITAISDGASGCKAHKDITKVIHEMPSVKMSRGATSVVDIHEGGEAEIVFEFWGTPPFEFTYTRSSNAVKGSRPQILDTKHETSYEHTKTVRASDEGTYEVVAIKDKFCSFSLPNVGRPAGKK